MSLQETARNRDFRSGIYEFCTFFAKSRVRIWYFADKTFISTLAGYFCPGWAGWISATRAHARTRVVRKRER
jgi:hypothetical protein